MILTPHFSLEELVRSEYAVRHGISNTPTTSIIISMRNLCHNALEPLRELVGKPINISSGYRSPSVNSGIGGASNSQHIKGEAADISVEGFSTQQLFLLIKDSTIPYDQLIQEFDSWVHISFGPRKRHMAMFAKKNSKNKTIYTPA